MFCRGFFVVVVLEGSLISAHIKIVEGDWNHVITKESYQTFLKSVM